MLKLSPMSTQCTHGATVKLFCRYIVDRIEQMLDHSYIVAPRMGVTPSVLQVNFGFLDGATMSMNISWMG